MGLVHGGGGGGGGHTFGPIFVKIPNCCLKTHSVEGGGGGSCPLTALSKCARHFINGVSHLAANACERSEFWGFVIVRKRLQTSLQTVFIVANNFLVAKKF